MTIMGAIREDGSSEEADGQGEATDQPILSPRELAMQEIQEQLDGEESSGGAVDMAAAPVTETTEQMVTVMLDGQEVQLTLAEVTKGYQKDAVASRRLEEAATKRKEMEQREKELNAREEQLKQQALTPSADDADVDAQIAAAMAALVEGDEVSAVQAMKSILKGRPSATSPQIDTATLIAQTKAELRAEEAQADQAKAWTEFQGSNPAFADAESKERKYGDYLFTEQYAPMIEAGEISYREALTRTAADVMAVYAPVTTNTRLDRKKAIDNLPVAGARSQRQAPAIESTEDVLAEMRRERGQPV